MFHDWAEETTTTTGTGDLTLAAAAGLPRISDVCSVGDQVCYAILSDATGAPIEVGIGTVGAGNTLVRSLPRATYSGSVYTGANVTAFALAAGTKRVILTPISNTFQGVALAMNANAAQRLIHSPHNAASGNTKALGAGNVCYYMPFLMQFGCEVDALVCQVTGAVAASVFRMGLYRVAPNGSVGTKMIETADLSGAVATIVAGAFTRRHIAPGWYYAAIASKAAAITVQAYAAGGAGNAIVPTPLGMSDFTLPYNQATETLAGGWTALPAAASGALGLQSIGTDFPPTIALRAV